MNSLRWRLLALSLLGVLLIAAGPAVYSRIATGVQTSSGTTLSVGSLTDGYLLARSGSSIVSVAPSGWTYRGTWSAATNTPDLDAATKYAGDEYIASDAGTFHGIAYLAADLIIWNGTAWQRIAGTDPDDLHQPASGGGLLYGLAGSTATTGRTLTGPAAGLTVANGDGSGGNPTLALVNDLSALEGLSSTSCLAERTATDTWSCVTANTTPTISGESYTPVLLLGRRYNLLASNIADLVTNPPTGWAWVNAASNVASANISGGSLTINAGTSTSYNTTSANPVLYLKGVTSSATLTVHCRNSGNESFEGGFVYVSESRGATDGVRIGPAGSDCDLEAFDSTSVKPLAMACDDWWWARVTVNATTVSWWMQSNGSTGSAEPSAIGSDYTSTWVYGGQTTLSTREGAYQTELGIGILRTGAVSGSFRLNCDTVRVTIPGEF